LARYSTVSTRRLQNYGIFKNLRGQFRDARGNLGPLGPFGCFDLEVEDTGIEPVTSSLQSWRSPS
jgi:hypothetical protein